MKKYSLTSTILLILHLELLTCSLSHRADSTYSFLEDEGHAASGVLGFVQPNSSLANASSEVPDAQQDSHFEDMPDFAENAEKHQEEKLEDLKTEMRMNAVCYWTSWVLASGSVLATTYILMSTTAYVFSKDRHIHRDLRTMCAAGLLSIPQYFVIALPLMIPTVRKLMTPTMFENYLWVPAWNMFCLTDNFGEWIHTCWNMLFGNLLGILAVAFLNALMPGGATCSDHPACLEEQGAGLLGGYSISVAYAYLTTAAYAICILDIDMDFKRCFLSSFGSRGLDYISPLLDWKQLSPILFSYDGRFNFRGQAGCSLIIISFAFLLRAPFQFAFPLHTLTGGSVSFDSFSRGDQELNLLAHRTLRCLKFLVTRRAAMRFEVEDNKRDIAMLYEQVRKLDAMIDEAWWQAFTTHRQLRLKKMYALSSFFKRSTHILLLASENEVCNKEHASMVAFAPRFSAFFLVVSRVLEDACHSGGTAPLQDVSSAIHELSEISNTLSDIKRQGEMSLDEYAEQQVYMTSLRAWAVQLGKLQKILSADLPEVRLRWSLWLSLKSWASSSAHRQAIRQTLGFVVCIVYCKQLRYCYATTVMTYAFLLQPDTTLKASMVRILWRLLGCTMGLIGGHLPSVVLCVHLTSFRNLLPDLLSFVCAIICWWYFSCCGALRRNAPIALAFYLFGALSGVELLRPLNALMDTTLHSDVNDLRVTAFQKIVDTFFAALVITGVDLLSQILVTQKTSHRAAELLSEAVAMCARTLEFFTHTGEDVSDDDLDAAYHKAQRWAVYAEEEQDLLMGFWPKELVSVLDSELQSFYLHLRALSSLRASLGEELFATIMQQVLPQGIITSLREYSRVILLAVGVRCHGTGLVLDEPCVKWQVDETLLVGSAYNHVISESQLHVSPRITKEDLDNPQFLMSFSVISKHVFAICKSAKRIHLALRREEHRSLDDGCCNKSSSSLLCST
eukprot:TRINITY_DN15557_c0_g2_i1.p1 TRINITY_DN15557_c0_g2~~TRINITY_DN15557_c0_g2_i1.p1  ORF type:complete len:959 (-),score=77.37 TRINITY_DN15557_c0_g2_i1:156-3032(-)